MPSVAVVVNLYYRGDRTAMQAWGCLIPEGICRPPHFSIPFIATHTQAHTIFYWLSPLLSLCHVHSHILTCRRSGQTLQRQGILTCHRQHGCCSGPTPGYTHDATSQHASLPELPLSPDRHGCWTAQAPDEPPLSEPSQIPIHEKHAFFKYDRFKKRALLYFI